MPVAAAPATCEANWVAADAENPLPGTVELLEPPHPAKNSARPSAHSMPADRTGEREAREDVLVIMRPIKVSFLFLTYSRIFQSYIVEMARPQGQLEGGQKPSLTFSALVGSEEIAMTAPAKRTAPRENRAAPTEEPPKGWHHNSSTVTPTFAAPASFKNALYPNPFSSALTERASNCCFHRSVIWVVYFAGRMRAAFRAFGNHFTLAPAAFLNRRRSCRHRANGK